MNPTPLSLTQASTLNNLVDSVRIRPASIDLPKAERFIEQASLALVELPTIRTHQLRYDGGYNAAHDVGEALMAAYGFRTVHGPGQHMSIGEVLLIFLKEPLLKMQLRISMIFERHETNLGMLLPQ